MSVLFADLVGYTAMAEGLDPEQVKNLVDGCFERLVADVVSFGGRVDKIIGDAIVALFGAPVAHEDDAERAVRAALRMQGTLRAYADSLGLSVQMRVGVNTGEVLVGALRAGGDYTAMGDVVNAAERLQTAAPPGGILVGPATRSATTGVIRYESVGPVRARGREEPIDGWLALEAMAPPGRRARKVKAPFVGRDTELALLVDGIRLAVEPLPSVPRPPSRARAASARAGSSARPLARAQEVLRLKVLVGRCMPYGESNPWHPIGMAISADVGLDPAAGPAAVRAQLEAAVTSTVGLVADPERVTHRAPAPLGPPDAARRHRPHPGPRRGRAGRPRLPARPGPARPAAHRHRRSRLGRPAAGRPARADAGAPGRPAVRGDDHGPTGRGPLAAAAGPPQHPGAAGRRPRPGRRRRAGAGHAGRRGQRRRAHATSSNAVAATRCSWRSWRRW